MEPASREEPCRQPAAKRRIIIKGIIAGEKATVQTTFPPEKLMDYGDPLMVAVASGDVAQLTPILERWQTAKVSRRRNDSM